MKPALIKIQEYTLQLAHIKKDPIDDHIIQSQHSDYREGRFFPDDNPSYQKCNELIEMQ